MEFIIELLLRAQNLELEVTETTVMQENAYSIEIPGKKNKKGKPLPGLKLGGIGENVVLSSTDSQLEHVIPGDVIVKDEAKQYGGFLKKALGWVELIPIQSIKNTILQSGGVIRLTLVRPDASRNMDSAAACSDFEGRHGLKWENDKLVNVSDESPFNFDKFNGDRVANDRRYEEICQTLVNYLYAMMEEEHSMTRTYIPYPKPTLPVTPTKCPMFCSETDGPSVQPDCTPLIPTVQACCATQCYNRTKISS